MFIRFRGLVILRENVVEMIVDTFTAKDLILEKSTGVGREIVPNVQSVIKSFLEEVFIKDIRSVVRAGLKNLLIKYALTVEKKLGITTLSFVSNALGAKTDQLGKVVSLNFLV